MSDSPKYRILLLGDYSNMHSQLGRTLRAAGHDVTVMSEGSGFQDTRRDIDISRRKGRLGGAILTARCLWPLHRYMRGYDIVAIQNPHFLHLRPRRLRYFFDRLRGENRAVFLTAAGADEFYIREALDAASVLRYNEYRIGDRPAPFAVENPRRLTEWQRPEMMSYADHVYDSVDGVVTALYEYDVAVRRRLGRDSDKVAYGGIPIDTGALPFSPMNFSDGNVRLFLGRHRGRLAEKGTDILERAARRVADSSHGRVVLEIVENRPYDEYSRILKDSHIVLDQVYSYSPATNAMIAMSRGIATVSGGEPDFYDFIGEPALRPVINAVPYEDTLTDILHAVTADTDALALRGRQSRDFVVRHNDAAVVADRFLRFWESRLR